MRRNKVIAAAMTVVLALSQMLGTATAAFAAGETGLFYNAFSPKEYLGGFDVANVDIGAFNGKDAVFFGGYQKVGDTGESGVAYCMDGMLDGPGYGKVTYVREGGTDAALSYAAAHGYPNTNTIAGTALSAGDARAATQIAIWYLRGYDVRDHFNNPATEAQARDCEVGIRLAEEARAYADAGGANLGCGSVWYSTGDRQRVMLTSVPHGGFTLTKASSTPAISDGNGCYSLKGAVYTVYADARCATAVGTITTDASGNGSIEGLALGDYWVKETSAAPGYALSDVVAKVSVPGGTPGHVDVQDVPQANDLGLLLAKVDAETGEPSPLGAATLSGATFEVRYYAGRYDEASLPARATRTWTVTTKGDGTASLEDATGDELYRDGEGRACVPLGTVAIAEKAAPEGYNASTETHVVNVTASGSAALVSTYVAPRVAEQVKRGDLELVKVAGRSQSRLAGVPFRITSATTGESHVIVTDKNGQASTASSWNRHTSKTNANDVLAPEEMSADAGVWFGSTAADDSKGALPYDEYLVEELRCTSNEGLELVSFGVSVTRDGACVDAGTVTDHEGPRIGTTLTDADGEHMAPASERVTLVDEVAYENLTPGKEYALTGTLMDRETGEPVTDADGNPVRSQASLVPSLSSGTAKVTFEFDASALGGHRVVAFEELSQGGAVVATHADLGDEGQTVTVPRIGTEATDAESGLHESSAGAEVTIRDEVSYEGLVPGLSYELTGTLVDRETGEPVKDASGKPVTATTTFSPDEPDGNAEVTFAFDGSLLAGRTIVAFETLEHDGREYAAHADLEDGGQSVSFPKVGTQARDAADGDSLIDAAKGQRVLDKVSYENLTPGVEYEVEGTLVDRETGEELARATTSLTPDNTDGETEVEFGLDATGLEGRSLVCTERLVREGRVLATHEDLSDEGQTVSLPSVHTTATDASDGDHEVQATIEAQVVDRVEWSGLVEGREYTVTGTLVDKESGKPITDASGSPVTASATFTADAPAGHTDVTFAFDASALAGHELVAFEDISHEGRTVAVHADLNDEGQTVRVTQPPAPEGQKPTGDLPRTGDATAPIAGLAVAGLAAVGACALARRRGDQDIPSDEDGGSATEGRRANR